MSKCCNSCSKPCSCSDSLPCGSSPWDRCTIAATLNGTPLATVCDQIIPTGLVTRGDGRNLIGALAENVPDLGGGSRLTWDRNRSALRAGTVDADQWDAGNVGNASTAVGTNNIASGENSFASGIDVVASGSAAHAEGIETVSAGTGSHAEGITTFATGNGSHASGIIAIASEPGAHAEGIIAFATGTSSHAEGILTFANQTASHAEGIFTQANEAGVHIMGTFGSSTTDPFSWQLAGGTSLSGIPGDGLSAIVRTTVFGTPQPSGEIITNVFTSANADFAEYFEWTDGNPLNEDRVGYFVELVNGNKIQIATSQANVIGVTSRTACVNADAAELGDPNAILKDLFGRPITQDSYTVGANVVLAQYGTLLTDVYLDKEQMVNAAIDTAVADLLNKLYEPEGRISNDRAVKQKPLNLGGVLGGVLAPVTGILTPVTGLLAGLPINDLIAQLGLLPSSPNLSNVQNLVSKLKLAQVNPLTLIISQLVMILQSFKFNPTNIFLTDLLAILGAKQVGTAKSKVVNLSNYSKNLPITNLLTLLNAVPIEIPILSQLPIVYTPDTLSLYELADKLGLPIADLAYQLNLPIAGIVTPISATIAELAMALNVGNISLADLVNKINAPIAELLGKLLITNIPIPDLAATLGLTLEQLFAGLGNFPLAAITNFNSLPAREISKGFGLPLADVISKLNLSGLPLADLASKLGLPLDGLLDSLGNLPLADLLDLNNLPLSGLLGVLDGPLRSDLLANLPTAGLLAGLPISGLPVSDLPIANLLGNLPVSGLLGNLSASGLIRGLSLPEIVGNVPTGNLPINNILDSLSLSALLSNLPVTGLLSNPSGNSVITGLLNNLSTSGVLNGLPIGGNLPVAGLVNGLPIAGGLLSGLVGGLPNLHQALPGVRSVNSRTILPTQRVLTVLAQYGINISDGDYSPDHITSLFTDQIRDKLNAVKSVKVSIPNPEYVPDVVPYLPRSKDPKWIPVGLLGKIYVRDDGNCVVGGLCQSNANGIATPAGDTFSPEVRYRVIARSSSDPNVIRILFQHVHLYQNPV